MSVKGSNIMKNAQIEKTRQTVQQLVEWYSKKQQFFKVYLPIQQSLIKKFFAAPEITLGRLKEIAQIVVEEKQIQATFFEKTEKALLAEDVRFLPRTEEKIDPKDPKGVSKIKQQLPTWSNNIDRVLLSMSRSFRQKRARIKQAYKTLQGIQGELVKEEQRYKTQLKKQQKDLQRLFEKLDEHEKQSSKILGKIIKESKGENIKDSAFFISQIKAIEKNLHGEYQCLADRNQILLKLIQTILKNEKAVSHKVKEQLTAFLTYCRQHHGKESKLDEQVWGFLSIAEERIQEQRLKYFNTMLLKPQRIQQLKNIFDKAQFKSNWQVIVRFLQLNKEQLMKSISAKQEMSKLMKNISYRCWEGIALAQGWLIETYTPAVIYMTYDYNMIIYSLPGEQIKKISTNCSKVKKTEGQTLFLQEKQKGFFSDSLEEYKIKFQDPERLEEFQLFIENQVK